MAQQQRAQGPSDPEATGGGMSDAPDRREDAVDVVRALRAAGHVAYLAGGCVRDELLGLTPTDYDVATDAHPDVVRGLFTRARTEAVGAAFGVILVRRGQSVIEVATFRTDLAYADGRRPSGVVFTSAEEDARRRDFTVNGLFRDPLVEDPADDGVIDYVGGKADLRDRVLRAIGEPQRRFDEDYLRMLRAVRFAARFGFAIEPATWEAMVRFAPRLSAIAPERVADELRRMLGHETRGEAWRLLWASGLLGVILRTLPEQVPPMPPHRPVLDYLADVGRPVSFGLALAGTVVEVRLAAGVPARVILEPAEVKRVAAACRRTLRYSNDEAANLVGALSLWPLVQEAPPSVALMKRFLAGPFADDARVMLAALASQPALSGRAAWLAARLEDLSRQDVAPPPFVTGDDLVAMGLTPGPAFKRVLDEAYDAQLEGRVATRDEAIRRARASENL